MTEDEKNLLLKDLCARLPYGVICEDGYGNVLELNSIDKPNNATFKCSKKIFWTTDLDKCKPYLFPLSSIEEEKINEFFNDLAKLKIKAIINEIDDKKVVEFEVDWYQKNHVDYRGLIEKGLAIDATGLNIY